MKSKKEIDTIKKAISKIVMDILNNYVTKPAIETVNNDFHVQDKIAEVFLLTEMLCEVIVERGTILDTTTSTEKINYQEWERRKISIEKFIDNLEKANDKEFKIPEEVQQIIKIYSAKKHLPLYFNREIKWICISVLSASYISSYVLMRSCFELLVNISTKNKNGMKDKLFSIEFFKEAEKRKLLKLWRHLCKWAHPHKQWTKEVCPIYVNHNPAYHPKLANDSIKTLEKIVGFFLVVALNVFDLEKDYIAKIAKKSHININKFSFM